MVGWPHSYTIKVLIFISWAWHMLSKQMVDAFRRRNKIKQLQNYKRFACDDFGMILWQLITHSLPRFQRPKQTIFEVFSFRFLKHRSAHGSREACRNFPKVPPSILWACWPASSETWLSSEANFLSWQFPTSWDSRACCRQIVFGKKRGSKH